MDEAVRRKKRRSTSSNIYLDYSVSGVPRNANRVMDRESDRSVCVCLTEDELRT